ncbi:MAG: hypothetical protein HKN43_15425 [Rhodothermales bacterium]|nr:hypothetical protein [Rhodothermales bacterium]
MHHRKIISIIGLCLWALPSFGQRLPDHETLLRSWFVKQRTALASVDTLFYDEMSTWKIDAPFGSPTLELQSNVRETPFGQRVWRRSISARLNGQDVPAARLDEVKNRWHTNTRNQIGEMVSQIRPRPGLLERMSPVSSVTPETIDGVDALRLEVVQNDRRMNLERLTFWFARDSRQLLRTRAIVSGSEGAQSFVVTTDYMSVGQLDTPVSRQVEGNVRLKRRSRYYTVLISQSQEFSNFRFDR